MFCHPEKSHLYKDKFHPLIQQRISSQMTYDMMCVASDTLADLILDAFDWDKSDEGSAFWNDVYHLHLDREPPTEEELLAVFHKFNIEA